MKLTRNEILSMEAGRELDALVAAEVMEWTAQPVEGTDEVMWYHATQDFSEPIWVGYVSRHVHGLLGVLQWKLADGRVCYKPDKGQVWQPSKSIAAAWQVVEKLRKRFFITRLLLWDHTDTVALVCEPRCGHGQRALNPDLTVDAETAPLAICRAALLAVMEADE